MNLSFSNPNYPYLEIEEGSKTLTSGKSAFIFAPNGSGKTTLFNILADNNKDDVILYTYSEEEANYGKIEKKTKTLEIDFLPKDYKKLTDEIKHYEEELSIKKQLDHLGAKRRKDFDSEVFNDYLKKHFSDVLLDDVARLSSEQRTLLEPLLKSGQSDITWALKNFEKIRALSEEEQRIRAEALIHDDIRKAFNEFKVENHKKEIEKDGCPFCGGRGETGHPYEDILNRKSKLLAEKVLFFADCQFLSGVREVEECIRLIDQVKKGLLSLSEEQVLTLVFTAGDASKEEYLASAIKILETKKAEEKVESDARNRSFDLIKETREKIRKPFSDRFEGCDIDVKDKDKTVSIITARPPSSYSEGEKHQMYLTLMRLAIAGSQKPYVLIDDPLTELDAANEYKTAFDIASIINNSSKTVVVFSCNISLVNHLLGNVKDLELLYMESWKKGGVTKTKISDLTLGDEREDKREDKRGKEEPRFTIKNLIGIKKSSDNEDKIVEMVARRALIEALSEDQREHDKKLDEYYSSASKIMHFDADYKDDTEIHLSNMDLVKYAEEFDSEKIERDFVKSYRPKLALLASMRVFLEKKLIDFDEAHLAAVASENYLIRGKCCSLYQKIDCVGKVKDWPITNLYKNWNRVALMELKTMLNDVDHPYGLVHPLHFAMSLSWEDIIRELNVIREMFA